MFSKEDINQLKEKGIVEKTVLNQLDRFSKGFNSLELQKPATIGDGILQLTEEEIKDHIDIYDKNDLEVVKFVPASGAASRMFKQLFALLEGDNNSQDETFLHFFYKIKDFAFYDDLKEVFEKNNDQSFQDAVDEKNIKVIEYLLLEKGLDYGSLPKGLLRFHVYEEEVRTPVQEHLAEGYAYARKNNVVNLHFTVSPSHMEKFKSHVNEAVKRFDKDIKINVSYSIQKPATDTVAADLDNGLFRTDKDELLFRPAGHGALLENLNELDQDIIFIKNIDNVVPDRIKEETIKYKKALAGVLINFQKQAFELLHKADTGEDISDEGNKLLQQMGFHGDLASEQIYSKLNRPIRVCGMVKNEGEPGGGPFWVKNDAGSTLQIVESAQVNEERGDQLNVFKASTHFNPVDIVCGIKDYKKQKFNLRKFRDDDSGFITEKSYQGRKLKAMELPGLWNGSMADWNTVFVEVPLITFNPVKTVMDLLKENHQ